MNGQSVRLAIIRHGHTAWNREGRIQGHTDIPLEADVIEEMCQLEVPPEWQSADVVASPLLRARQTAELLWRRAPGIEPSLIEMNWGVWEGRCGRDIAKDPASGFRHLTDWGWDYRAPEGESPAEVRTRLQPWLQSLAHDTVAVCHIGIMRVLLAMAHGWSFSGQPPFEIKRNRLYVLRIGDAQARLAPAEPGIVRLARIQPGSDVNAHSGESG